MGEARKDALRLGFDRAIKLEFHRARVSSAAGLFPYRDLDDAAWLMELRLTCLTFGPATTSATA